MESCAHWCGLDGVKEVWNFVGGSEVVISGQVLFVEKVEVDTIGVVRSADGRDGAESGGHLASEGPTHTAGVSN